MNPKCDFCLMATILEQMTLNYPDLKYPTGLCGLNNSDCMLN